MVYLRIHFAPPFSDLSFRITYNREQIRIRTGTRADSGEERLWILTKTSQHEAAYLVLKEAAEFLETA